MASYAFSDVVAKRLLRPSPLDPRILGVATGGAIQLELMPALQK
jgi:hypothetical protein